MMSKNAALISVFILLSFFVKAQKNDTVVLLNNNIITGEIKKLEQGQLTFKTDGMGTVYIKAEEIKSMKSNKRFQIQLSNSYIYFGTFDTVNSPTKAIVKIITSSGTVYKMEMKDVVEIFPFRKKLWYRLSGNLSAGVNYNKSSKIFQFNISGNLSYWGKKRYFNVGWNDNISTLTDSVITNKQTNTLTYRHYIKKGFSGQSSFEYSRNKELSLQRRFSLNALGGKDIIHRYRSLLYFGTGVSANSELYYGDTTANLNMEWVFQLSFDIYKRTFPEISLSTYANLYPSLTIKQRYRANVTIDTRIEVFNNFFVGVQFYDDFDNKPQTSYGDTESHTNDWGLNGTISYSFH